MDNKKYTKKKRNSISINRGFFNGMSLLLVILILTTAFFSASYFKKSSENKELTESVNSLNTQLTELEEKYNGVNSQIDELESVITQLRGEEDDESSELVQKLKDIESNMKSLETEKEQLLAQLKTVEEEKKALEEYKDRDEAYKELENKYNELKSNYDSVNSKYELIVDKYNALAVQLRALEHIEPENDNKDDHSDLDKVCYLTFDDGPSVENTTKILNILKENNIKATFFVNKKGEKTGTYDAIYKRIVDEGHTIGNHTATHQYKSVYTNLEGFMKEFEDLQNYVYSKTGVYPQVFRFPGGSGNKVHRGYNEDIMPLAANALKQMGVNYYDWNVNSTDADTSLQTVENIIKYATNVGNKKKIIVLMHDMPSKTTTPEALPEVIRILREKGFEFRALNNSVEPIQSLKV